MKEPTLRDLLLTKLDLWGPDASEMILKRLAKDNIEIGPRLPQPLSELADSYLDFVYEQLAVAELRFGVFFICQTLVRMGVISMEEKEETKA